MEIDALPLLSLCLRERKIFSSPTVVGLSVKKMWNKQHLTRSDTYHPRGGKKEKFLIFKIFFYEKTKIFSLIQILAFSVAVGIVLQ